MEANIRIELMSPGYKAGALAIELIRQIEGSTIQIIEILDPHDGSLRGD